MKNIALTAIFFLSTLLAVPSLYPKVVKDQSAFYALSSLRYHLESELADCDECSPFSYDDIEKLWEKAGRSKAPWINLAQQNYYESFGQSEGNKQKLLAESRDLLYLAWQEAHPYLDSTNQITAKGDDFSQYLLPDTNPLWQILDSLFSNPKVLDTPKTFSKTGFITISERPSGMFVAKHPDLPGYLVKAYIHSKKIKKDWTWCINRCWGVANIRELIEDKNLQHFVVPDKWIYPFQSSQVNQDLLSMTTPAVLVVKDMQLVPKSASRAAWKSIPTHRHIQELYCILSHGYSSCSLPSNIPYTTFGKFACIDTEHPQRMLPYHHVARHLSEEMAEYWNYLLRTGGRGLPF